MFGRKKYPVGTSSLSITPLLRGCAENSRSLRLGIFIILEGLKPGLKARG